VARRVFFSFHYEDILAVNIVRNSNVVKTQYEPRSRAFFDKSLWEEAKKQGDRAIRKMIDDGLDGSSVTCVLIGQQTWARPWVRYELLKSFERGNGILGIHIHDVGIANSLSSRMYPGMSTLLGQALAIPVGPTRGLDPLDYVGFHAEPTSPGTLLTSLLSIPTQRAVPCHFVNGTWQRDDRVNSVLMNDSGHRLSRFQTGKKFSSLFRVYDWDAGNGYSNFRQWIERAALDASWV